MRLLVAEETPGGLVDLAREMRIVRLGQDVDRTGRLAEAAVERTLGALEEYRQIIESFGTEKIRFVGTSAMRDAENGAEFRARAKELLGVDPEVVPGTVEANLSYTGAVLSLETPAPRLVIDIGGGSTEFVRGAAEMESALSIDIGSVRVTERFGVNFEQAAGWIDEQLDQVLATISIADLGALIGVAGTVTTLAAHSIGVTEYDPQLTHGAFLNWQQWETECDFMIHAPIEEKALLPVMPKGRADVIAGGALIWQRIIRLVARSCPGLSGAYVSERDILDGIALALAAEHR